MAAGACTPLQGKSTTGFAACFPSKRDASTAPSRRHPRLFVPLTESYSKSLSTSSPVLLPIIYTPSSHFLSHSGWPVTPGIYTLSKSSFEKLSQSPFVYGATVKSYPLITHTSVPGSFNTASRSLIPNSHVTESHNSSNARNVPPSNAPYEPFRPSQIAPTYKTATSMSSLVPESHQTGFSTNTNAVSETSRPIPPTPASTTDATGGQPIVSLPSPTTSMGPTTPANGAVASATNVTANPVQGASLSSTGHA